MWENGSTIICKVDGGLLTFVWRIIVTFTTAICVFYEYVLHILCILCIYVFAYLCGCELNVYLCLVVCLCVWWFYFCCTRLFDLFYCVWLLICSILRVYCAPQFSLVYSILRTYCAPQFSLTSHRGMQDSYLKVKQKITGALVHGVGYFLYR